jgi:hypothetical protein
MRRLIEIVMTFGLVATSCAGAPGENRSGSIAPQIMKQQSVASRDQVLRIAEEDAKRAYDDLSVYNVRCEFRDDGWHVVYVLKNPKLQGGGPRYLIDQTGRIVAKRYEQ